MSLMPSVCITPHTHNQDSHVVVFWQNLTHRGRVQYMCVSDQAIIVSDNVLLPFRHQVIIRNYTGLL